MTAVASARRRLPLRKTRSTDARAPREVEDRAIPGHWEGDLISGSNNSHIVTLVERHSRFTALIKVSSRDSDTVVAALARHVRKLPASLRRSLTWDRGNRDGKAPDLYSRDRCESLLLRSSKPLAARHPREYQPLAATILPQGHRSVLPSPISTRQGRPPFESASTEDVGI